jgi:membrane protein DedA with SNARE-associated domain
LASNSNGAMSSVPDSRDNMALEAMPGVGFHLRGMDHVITSYGYLAIAVVIGIESMGIPLPGQTMLILAAMYAAKNPNLNIWLIVAAAAAGAIIGHNGGYWIGSRFGYPLLRRFGSRFGVSDRRIKLGQYLFATFGPWVVFFGRFVAPLRMLAAFLAGVNRMNWSLFMLANAAGGVLWALVFALSGYYLGKIVFEVQGTLGPIIVGGASILFLAMGLLVRHQEDRFQERAERALPGPLQ